VRSGGIAGRRSGTGFGPMAVLGWRRSAVIVHQFRPLLPVHRLRLLGMNRLCRLGMMRGRRNGCCRGGRSGGNRRSLPYRRTLLLPFAGEHFVCARARDHAGCRRRIAGSEHVGAQGCRRADGTRDIAICAGAGQIIRLALGRVGIFAAGQPFGENVGGLLLLAFGDIQLRLAGNLIAHAGDDEDFLKTGKICRRADENIHQRTVRIGHGALDGSNRQAAGKDCVSAAGHDRFAGLNAVIGRNVDDLRLSPGASAQHTANPRGLENHACSAGGVRYLQDLAGVIEDLSGFADDAIRGDDGHIEPDAILRSLVDDQHVRILCA
jgi:hypothetical protein